MNTRRDLKNYVPVTLTTRYSEQLLLQYLYEGLSNMERSMIDAASGGTLGDMTPAEARNLI